MAIYYVLFSIICQVSLSDKCQPHCLVSVYLPSEAAVPTKFLPPASRIFPLSVTESWKAFDSGNLILQIYDEISDFEGIIKSVC